jgi:hypothetical protein
VYELFVLLSYDIAMQMCLICPAGRSLFFQSERNNLQKTGVRISSGGGHIAERMAHRAKKRISNIEHRILNYEL